jgi:uncharacterized protein YndB with AHSA1/START domain
MADSDRNELTIIRIFDAPRELVWKAWTDQDMLAKWWGPKHFTSPVNKADLRVGGKYLNCMQSPDGKKFWSTGIYREIVPFEKLVMTDSFADENGNVIPASQYGFGSDFPLEMLITVTLEEHPPALGGKTKLILTHSGIDTLNETDLGNMKQGWSESFDKLSESLK